MSIATAITDLSGRIQGAYSALENKGAEMPQVRDTYHLSAAIDSIPAGDATKYGVDVNALLGDVDANGELHDPSVSQSQHLVMNGVKSIEDSILANKFNYSFALKSASFPDLSSVGQYSLQNCFMGSFISSISFPKLSSVTKKQALQSACGSCTKLSSMDMSSLETINAVSACAGMFKSTKLTRADLPSLKSVNGNYATYQMFYGCSQLTSMNLSSLLSADGTTQPMGQMFQNCSQLSTATFENLRTLGVWGSTCGAVFNGIFANCTQLRDISFPQLSTVTHANGATTAALAYMSNGCSRLTSVSFPSLVNVGNYGCGYAFYGAQNLQEVRFPLVLKLNNSSFVYNDYVQRFYFPSVSVANFAYVFTGCTRLVEIHFAAANKTVIEASTGYATKWNAPNANCQILFDL